MSKAQTSDSYAEELAKIIYNLEVIYGLKQVVNGTELIKCDINSVLQHVKAERAKLGASQQYNANLQAGESLVLLSYVSMRMKYYNKKRLDFSNYPYMDMIAKILIKFTYGGTVTKEAILELNKIIVIMSQIDDNFVVHKFGLGYRYLRIFIILILYGNYPNAAVVADFIINQLVTKR